MKKAGITRIPCKGLWDRIKSHLDSLPNDEVLSGLELARAVGTTRPSLNVNLDFEVPEIALRSMIVRDKATGTPRKRVYGNPRAIKSLQKQLERA